MSEAEKEYLRELKEYVNQTDVIIEDVDSNDMREIRKMIRIEIAEIFFDLFRKRSVWV